MSLAPSGGKSILQASQKAHDSLAELSKGYEATEEPQDRVATARKHNDELERLDIWIAEHEVSKGELDHKLREASHLRGRVISLLQELYEISAKQSPTSSSTQQEYEHDSTAYLDIDSEIQAFSALKSQIKDDRSEKSGSLSIDTNFTVPDSLPDDSVAHIHETISNLLQLGPSLLDPSPHDRISQSGRSDAALLDIHHVRARFPKANERLMERLGMANWDRRQSMMRIRLGREEGVDWLHKVDSKQPASQDISPDPSDSTSDTDDSNESIMTATDLGSEGGELESLDSAATTRARSEFQFSVDGETQSTAGTEQSKSAENYPDIPAPPAKAERYAVPVPPSPNQKFSGDTFQCPFCSLNVTGIKSQMQWRKHVMNDIEPYMCTYPDCTLSAKTYGTKVSWWEHERIRHRTKYTWVCPPCKQDEHESTFDSSKSFEAHVDAHHQLKRASIQLRDMCQKVVGRRRPSTKCPLCQEFIPNQGGSKALERSVRKHVADHLEQLAFWSARPAGQISIEGDISKFQDDSDSEDGLQSEIASLVSKDTFLSKKDIQLVNVRTYIADQTIENPALGTALPGGSTAHYKAKSLPPGVAGAVTFPLHVQLPPLSEHFYCRGESVNDVHYVLESRGTICVIHGVGGVGKTLAAVQYLHTYKENFDAIIWFPADTAPGLAESFLQMVIALGICNSTDDHHHVIDKGREWLQETDTRWLLVFDNSLRWTDISRYMPNSLQRTNGSVIVTTQNPNLLAEAANVTKIRLDPLTPHAGSEMLLRYLGRDVKIDPEKELAKDISSYLGGLPVAIAHVAGYVSSSELELEELIDTFREWRKASGVAVTEDDDLPAAFREASSSYDETLAMVWEIILRELSKDARDVLNVFACLNCASVPRDMLWRVHEDPILHFLDNRQRVRMKRINEQLMNRRLLVENDSVFSMHRSLRRGIRTRLSQEKREQQIVFDRAVALVREVFPQANPLQQPTPSNWSEYQKLLPHLHALRDVYNDSAPDIKGGLDFAQLLLDAGADQFERGITHEGLLLLETSETVLDASSHDSPEGSLNMKADIHAMISMLYDDIGIEKREEALERRKSALHIRRTAYEKAATKRRNDEIMVYASEMEYAISLLHYHRYAAAERYIEKCLAKYREWGNEDEIPFEYAKYYNKIGLVKMYQGKFEEAIRLSERGVQLMEKTDYNLFAARFKFDMACIILQSGDPERALEVHEGIYRQRVEMLGQTNRLSLHSLYAIGAIHEMEGRLDEAESCFRRVLAQRRSVTSWSEEAFSRAQYHMAAVLTAQGRPHDIENASDLRAKAMDVLHRLLPLDMPPELEGVTDDSILFDHMLHPGGPRFTGRDLLRFFMKKA